ncbi:MAG: hypothetical protein JXR96_08440 [Deltaproteobacteria bacterium]|nr:hypothetical protein [Deltaproteobacteria bacterium]
MKQLTVRNVPARLAKLLDAERRRRRKSLNQTVLDLLCQALGLTPDAAYDNGLRRLSGTWSEEEFNEFEEHTSIFEQIDYELWRT